MKNQKSLVIAFSLLAGVWLLALLVINSSSNRVVSELPDGTSYTLALVAYTNNYSYSRRQIPDWARPFAPLIPDGIERKLFPAGGSIGLGTSAETNLMVVIDATNKRGMATRPESLRIRDEDGNAYDGTATTGMLSVGGDSSTVYLASVTPNRSKNLYLEPLVHLADGTWTNLGPFAITNPKYKVHPQWTPEPIPQLRADQDITASLVRFESGLGMTSVISRALTSDADPRSTFVGFEFTEAGQSVDCFRVHKITLSDATGNKWSPYLKNPSPAARSQATNAITRFVGGLWPGEDAWKIDLQAIRTGDFNPKDVWQVPPIPMPGANSFNELTNEFNLGETTIQIANILAPGVEVTNRWQWTVRYWGNEASVYPVGLECTNPGNRRPIILEARNENGTDFNILNHQNVDHPMQSIFLQPPPEGATELNLKMAFPELKEFEFIARPEFVE